MNKNQENLLKHYGFKIADLSLEISSLNQGDISPNYLEEKKFELNRAIIASEIATIEIFGGDAKYIAYELGVSRN